MASKSQTKYMIACAFASGVSVCMWRHYKELDGLYQIKGMVADINDKALLALKKGDGLFTQNQIKTIEEKIQIMIDKGMENAASYQVYLAGVIGILSDRIAELPETSYKVKPLEKLVSVCADAHRYYEQRTRNEGLDRDGMAIMDEFNLLFSETS